MRMMFTSVIWRQAASAVILVPEPSGDKERPFSGVTKSGRVWRKVPGSDARSVTKDRDTELGSHKSSSPSLSVKTLKPS